MVGTHGKPGRPRSEAKRCAILTAATEVFLELGFGAASMDSVAQRAEVSKATVYKHFGSKEMLFGALIRARCRETLSPLQIPETDANDLEATLRATARRFVGLIMDERAVSLYRVVVAEASRFPELARAFYENGPKQAIGSLADYLCEEAARGHLDIRDPTMAAEHFFSLLSGYVHVRALLGIGRCRQAADLDDHIAGAVDTFMRAFASGASKAADAARDR